MPSATRNTASMRRRQSEAETVQPLWQTKTPLQPTANTRERLPGVWAATVQ